VIFLIKVYGYAFENYAVLQSMYLKYYYWLAKKRSIIEYNVTKRGLTKFQKKQQSRTDSNPTSLPWQTLHNNYAQFHIFTF
jgi:hypothetical protein